MVILFEVEENFDCLQDFSKKFKDYVFEHRMGFSTAHSSSAGLKGDDVKKLVFSSMDLICWCGGTFIPDESRKRKQRISLKTGCPAEIKITAEKGKLVIKKLDLNHNHGKLDLKDIDLKMKKLKFVKMFEVESVEQAEKKCENSDKSAKKAKLSLSGDNDDKQDLKEADIEEQESVLQETEVILETNDNTDVNSNENLPLNSSANILMKCEKVDREINTCGVYIGLKHLYMLIHYHLECNPDVELKPIVLSETKKLTEKLIMLADKVEEKTFVENAKQLNQLINKFMEEESTKSKESLISDVPAEKKSIPLSNYQQAFVERNNEFQLRYILEILHVPVESSEKIVKGQTLLDKSYFNDLRSENLSDVFANENVDFEKILLVNCESDCFKYLCEIIIEKKGMGKVCKICESKECPKAKKQVKWISCACCLFSFHYACVNIKRKPRAKHWYCINC